MKNIQLKSWVCLLLTTHCIAVLAADTTAAARATNKELPPGTIQTIQLIGRSVLAAKHNEIADPNAAQVKTRLQNLGQSLDEVIKADVKPTPGALRVANSLDQNKTKSTADHEVELREHQQDVDQKTNTLKQRLSELKAENQHRRQTLSESPENGHQPQMRHLLDKSQAISDEVDVALVDKSPERMTKLMRLRDRLTIKSLSEVQPARTVAEDTPTISTITRHRD